MYFIVASVMYILKPGRAIRINTCRTILKLAITRIAKLLGSVLHMNRLITTIYT